MTVTPHPASESVATVARPIQDPRHNQFGIKQNQPDTRPGQPNAYIHQLNPPHEKDSLQNARINTYAGPPCAHHDEPVNKAQSNRTPNLPALSSPYSNQIPLFRKVTNSDTSTPNWLNRRWHTSPHHPLTSIVAPTSEVDHSLLPSFGNRSVDASVATKFPSDRLTSVRLFVTGLHREVQPNHIRSALIHADPTLQIVHIDIQTCATPTNVAHVTLANRIDADHVDTAFVKLRNIVVFQLPVCIIPEVEHRSNVSAREPEKTGFVHPETKKGEPSFSEGSTKTRRLSQSVYHQLDTRNSIFFSKRNSNYRLTNCCTNPTSPSPLPPNVQPKPITHTSNILLPHPSSALTCTLTSPHPNSTHRVPQLRPMHSGQFSLRIPGREPSTPAHHPSLPPLPPSHSRSLVTSPTRFSQLHNLAHPLVKHRPHLNQNSAEDAAKTEDHAPTSAVVSLPSIPAVSKRPALDANTRDSPRTTHNFLQHQKVSTLHSPKRFSQHPPAGRTNSMDASWRKRSSGIYVSHSQKDEPSSGVERNAVQKRRRSPDSGFGQTHNSSNDAYNDSNVHSSLGWRPYRRPCGPQNRNSDGNWQRSERQNFDRSLNMDRVERGHPQSNETNLRRTGDGERLDFTKGVLHESNAEKRRRNRWDRPKDVRHDYPRHFEAPFHSLSARERCIDLLDSAAHGFTRLGVYQGRQVERTLNGLTRLEARTENLQAPRRLETCSPLKGRQHGGGKSPYKSETMVQTAQKIDAPNDLYCTQLRNDCSATIFDIPHGMDATDLKRELTRVGVVYVSAPVNGKAVLEFASPGRRAAAVARGYLLISKLRLNIRRCMPDDLLTLTNVGKGRRPVDTLNSDAMRNSGCGALANGNGIHEGDAGTIIDDSNNTGVDDIAVDAAIFGTVMNKVLENVVKRIGAENYSTGFREVFAYFEGKSKEESKKLAEKRVESQGSAKRTRTLAEQNLDEYLMGEPKQESKIVEPDTGNDTKDALHEVRVPRKQNVGDIDDNDQVPGKSATDVERVDKSDDSLQTDRVSGGAVSGKADLPGPGDCISGPVLVKSEQRREMSGTKDGMIDALEKDTTEKESSKPKHTNGKVRMDVVQDENSYKIGVSASSGVGGGKAGGTAKAGRHKKRAAPLTEETHISLQGREDSTVNEAVKPVLKRRRKTMTSPGASEVRFGSKGVKHSNAELGERQGACGRESLEPDTSFIEDGVVLIIREEVDQQGKKSEKDVACGKTAKTVGKKARCPMANRAEKMRECTVGMDTLTGEQLVKAELASLGKEELEEVKVREGMCARTEGIRWVRGGGKLTRKDGKEKGKVRVVRPQEEMGKESKRANRQEQRLLRKTMRQISADVEGLTLNVLQQRRKRVYTRKSAIHGMGLYAQEDIGVGELVIEYVGSVVRRSVADVREMRYEEQGIGDSYMFRMNSDSVIDATHRGGIGRYINHSCEPNLIAKIIGIGNDDHIVFYSKKAIRAHDELTYDYKFAVEDEDQKIMCLCQAPSCRKFLN